ncbi:hypothetical protein FKM82_030110 [Ascaphus truei]
MLEALIPGRSFRANHGAQTFRKFVPVSLTRLVNCSIRQTCQIRFLIFGIFGISGCFHNAAISHLRAVAKCAINLCSDLFNPGVRLASRNNQGSKGIVQSRILWSQFLISSQIGSILVQPHSMCSKSACSPHCLGHNGG